jgi:hypothetical protein
VCYLDEFKNFTTDSFADILSELRKYHVGFVLSGQFLAQLHPAVRAAIIGNIGTLITFQVGHEDAAELEHVLGYPVDTLTALNRGEVVARLMQEGQAQQPFIGQTYPYLDFAFPGRRAAVLDQSRRRYGRPREIVEAKLQRWQPPANENTALMPVRRPPRPSVQVNIENFYEGDRHDPNYDAHAVVLKKLAAVGYPKLPGAGK